jgi:Tfp pilus assembly protein PilV
MSLRYSQQQGLVLLEALVAGVFGALLVIALLRSSHRSLREARLLSVEAGAVIVVCDQLRSGETARCSEGNLLFTVGAP